VYTPEPPADALPPDPILAHAERIRASGVLGRSGHIRRLFDFLVACALQGRVPKEIEVAIDGFGKGSGFDSSRDALVRVYVHKLRRKLDDYYAAAGTGPDGRLVIPRGEYRLAVAARQEVPVTGRRELTRREWLGLGVIGLLLAASVALGWGLLRASAPGAAADVAAARRSAIWGPLLDDDLPVQVVIGDYYIFGERDPGGSQPSRLVRDFEINSRQDLERRIRDRPALAGRYEDVNFGYLPTSSAYALRDLLSVLLAAGKRVRITLASDFSPASFKSSHVVYVGYLSALGMLQDVVFAGSRFSVGSSYDELIDTLTGTPYVSEAGEPLTDSERYRDYAYFSTFAGPNGNRHVIIAGTRDTAVRQAAEMLVDPRRIAELAAKAGANADFEALYEVYGVNRTNIEARLLVAGPLDTGSIWSDPPGETPAAQATAAAPADAAGARVAAPEVGANPDPRSQSARSSAGSGLLTK
jgi:hypothetical protein